MSDSEATEIYELPTDFEAKTYQADNKRKNLNKTCNKKN